MGHVNGALALRQLRSIPGRYYRSNDTNRNSNSGIASELYFPNLRKAIIRIFDHGDTTNAGAFWSSPTFSRPNSQPAAANSEDEETSCFLSQVEELVIDKWTSFMSGTSLFPFDYLAMENVTCVRLSPRYIESGAKNIFRLLRRAKQLRTIVLDLRGGLDQLQKALTTLTQRLDQLSRIEHVVLDPHSQRLELDSLISRRAYHENTFYQRYAKELVDTVRELENEVDVNEFPLLQQLVLQIRVRHESIIHYFWSQITTSTPSDSQLKLDKAFLEDKVSWARLP